MRKSFNLSWNNPMSVARIVVGSLVALNLIAAYFVVKPPGGSPDELRNEVQDLTARLRQKRTALDRTRVLVTKIQAGRQEGEKFMAEYFLPRRTAYAAILSELTDLASKAQMKPKEGAYNVEPLEGSDTLSQMTISANFEGTYANLIRFINAVDKSPGLLIVEGLNATPQQGGGLLNVTLKIDTFVREDGSGL